MLSPAMTAFNGSLPDFGGGALLQQRNDELDEIKRKRKDTDAARKLGLSSAGGALFEAGLMPMTGAR